MNYAATIYQQDFLFWLQQQVELLQQGRLAELDVNNLVEELESMGISQHHQLLNRLRVLLMHLLKWQFQPRVNDRTAALDRFQPHPESLSSVAVVLVDGGYPGDSLAEAGLEATVDGGGNTLGTSPSCRQAKTLGGRTFLRLVGAMPASLAER